MAGSCAMPADRPISSAIAMVVESAGMAPHTIPSATPPSVTRSRWRLSAWTAASQIIASARQRQLEDVAEGGGKRQDPAGRHREAARGRRPAWCLRQPPELPRAEGNPGIRALPPPPLAPDFLAPPPLRRRL